MRAVSVLVLLTAVLAAAPAARAGRQPGSSRVPRPLAGEHLVVRLHRKLVLRASPSGTPLVRVGPQALFGGPLVLGVVTRRGRWLGVISQSLPNGRIGWVEARAKDVSVGTVSYAIHVDLSEHLLLVRRNGTVLRRISVGVGAPASPTPEGRFSVAEKLDGSSINPVYGCCILALSARQSKLPPGWDTSRPHFVAIHAGDGIGSGVSAGCLHATDADLRYLMRTIPLGTPVQIAP